MKVKVNNAPTTTRHWVVARYDENTKKLWYYGSWDNKEDAERAVEELGNGILVEKDKDDYMETALREGYREAYERALGKCVRARR